MTIPTNPLSFGNFTGSVQVAASQRLNRSGKTPRWLVWSFSWTSCLILIFFSSQPTGFLQNLPPLLGSQLPLSVFPVVEPGEVTCLVSNSDVASPNWTARHPEHGQEWGEQEASPAQGQVVTKDMLGKWEDLPHQSSSLEQDDLCLSSPTCVMLRWSYYVAWLWTCTIFGAQEQKDPTFKTESDILMREGVWDILTPGMALSDSKNLTAHSRI